MSPRKSEMEYSFVVTFAKANGGEEQFYLHARTENEAVARALKYSEGGRAKLLRVERLTPPK